MKLRTSLLLLTVSAFLLSGCYTQLQHTQRVNRITDEPSSSGTYSWNGDEEANPQQPRNKSGQSGKATRSDSDYDEGYEEGYYDGAEDAFYYKDYEAAEWYARHGFGNYYTNFPHHYGSLWRYNAGFHSPFYYDYYPRSFASISFHWGYGSIGAFYGFPHHWYRYRSWHHWDPYYAYGYGGPYFINNYYYGGYSKYIGVNKDRDNDRTYGRRTIGTNRVRSGDRVEAGTNGLLRNRGSSEVRQKTSGSTIRTRGRTTVDRPGTTRSGSDNGRVRSTGRTGRSGSGTTSSGTTRRTRDNNMQSSVNQNDNSRDNVSRSTYSSDWNYREMLNRARIENRIENSRAQEPDVNNQRDRLKTRFYNRIQIDFSNSSSNSGTRSNSININRSRSNSSSNNNGTIRSRSSSSSSSGTSSSTRTRSSSRSSGGSSDDGSSNRRSRGNN